MRLTALVLALTLAMSGCKGKVEDLDDFLVDDEARKVLQGEVPGASNVEEFHVPDSENVVFIRQYHPAPLSLMHPAQKHKINQVQEKILGILEHLHSTYGIDALYVEGLTHKSEPLVNQKLRKIRSDVDDPSSYELYLLNATAPLEVQPYAGAAVFNIRQGLKLLAAETRELNEAAIDAGPESDAVLRNREDYLVELMAEDDVRGLTVFVYGSGHDFKDNVADWNAGYFNSKLSLIVVTPTGVE